MFVVTPNPVNDSTLFSSTIAEPDLTVGEVEWIAGTYSEGDQVIKSSTHLVYESANDSNTDDPEVGAVAVPPTWVVIGATNRYKMFDTSTSTVSASSGNLTVELEPNTVTNAVAAFNIAGVSDVMITMTDPFAGVVYEETVNLANNDAVTDLYWYFFADIKKRTEFVVADLPAFKAATIKVEFTGSDIEIGVLISGQQLQIGISEYGTSLGANDYSRRSVDEFGNVSTIRRGVSKVVDYSVFVPTARVGYAFDLVTSLRTINCVWYATGQDLDPTLVYGYYTSFDEVIANPSTSTMSLTVESLV